VAVHPVSLDYQWHIDGQIPFGFNAGYSHNLDVGGKHADASDFEAVRPGATPHYDLVRLGAQATFRLPRSWQLQARGGGQWTEDALVPGEQFGIGGANAVRGYEEREITGDSGAVATVELITPDLLAARQIPSTALRLLGFADAGKAYNRLDTPCRAGQSTCLLTSLGIGARMVYKSLQLRLDVAHALKDAISTGSGDTRAHFLAIYNFP
jgi:hemolysin activation/secretion protein